MFDEERKFIDYGTEVYDGDPGTDEAVLAVASLDQKKAQAVDLLREADSFIVIALSDKPVDEDGNPTKLGEEGYDGHHLTADGILGMKVDGPRDLVYGHITMLYEGVIRAGLSLQDQAKTLAEADEERGED